MIDLNDDECICETYDASGGLENLVPNHSFEERTCCPFELSMMHCVDDWIQCSTGTTDYLNTCDFATLPSGFFSPAEHPLPGEPGGEGFIGFIAANTAREYVGACLDEPLLAGTTYVLNLFTAHGKGTSTLNLSVFGTPNCDDLPWDGYDCPEGVGDWELIANQHISYPELGEWIEVTLTFTPGTDINAIAIGGTCAAYFDNNYYYLDELTLSDTEAQYGIQSNGTWCDGDLELTAETSLTGGSWQWYKDGVALLGETEPTLAPHDYGEGEFNVVYFLDGSCVKLSHDIITTGLNADLDIVEPLCFGDQNGWVVVDSVFNSSGDYSQISFDWNPNPVDENGIGADSIWAIGAGDYTLTITDENGCTQTIDFTVDQPEELIFAELGFDPALCRVFNYQNGNGVVFASSSGGTGDYDYLWTYLEDGSTTINSTWGGRNPGAYQITVTDDNGCTLTEIVQLDSISPIADFNIISDQLNPDCSGTADIEVEFVNQSQNYLDPNDPAADPYFFWNLDESGNGNWQITTDFDQSYDTLYQDRGYSYTVDVCLVTQNKNGCLDSLCKPLVIYEPIQFDPINVFTPNSDGVNDIFTFDFRSKSIQDLHCVVLNRWGIIVGEFDGVESGWNGTNSDGEPCPDGTYFYKYNAVSDDGTLLNGQGTVQLINGN